MIWSFVRSIEYDQGFYPEGIWTAPTDEALKTDIELSMNVGFNGARLHQKVFEERFHYWADKLGYLTWGEFTDWGTAFDNPQSLLNIKREWREVILRDLNHPSIIAWTPLNETEMLFHYSLVSIPVLFQECSIDIIALHRANLINSIMAGIPFDDPQFRLEPF